MDFPPLFLVLFLCSFGEANQILVESEDGSGDDDGFIKEICGFNPPVIRDLAKDKGLKGCALDEEDAESLQAAAVVFRGGARTPYGTYPTDPYEDYDFGGLGQGQLTGSGKHSSLRLGQFLRCRYAPLLQKKYSEHEVFCRSSEADRSLMSANALLAGLFPPLRKEHMKALKGPKPNDLADIRWQPVPCFSLDKDRDNKLGSLKRALEGCPKYRALLEEGVEAFLETLDKKTIKLLRNISEATGDPANFQHLLRAYDAVTIQHCQFDLPFPPWFPPLGKEMRKLVVAGSAQFVSSFEMKRLISGPLLHDIVLGLDTSVGVVEEGMSAAQVGALRRAKMNVFSAHDNTLWHLLSTLGVNDLDPDLNSDIPKGAMIFPPPYNAAIFFEVHSGMEEENDFEIKLFYRPDASKGKVFEVKMLTCGSPCSYATFKELSRPLRPTPAEWEDLCGLQTCDPSATPDPLKAPLHDETPFKFF